MLHENMMKELGPIQERAAALEKKPDEVRAILKNGAQRCEKIAAGVMDEVRKKTGLR
jgi:hypothetical protein